MSKKELTDGEKEKLKAHAKHHTKKHIRRMTAMMKQGLTFKKAHLKTRSLERAEAKKRGKKKPASQVTQKQSQRQVVNITLGASRRRAKAKPKAQRSVREHRLTDKNVRMAYSMITTPSTANINMLQADVNFIRNKALELEQSMGHMSQQQRLYNNDAGARQPANPITINPTINPVITVPTPHVATPRVATPAPPTTPAPPRSPAIRRLRGEQLRRQDADFMRASPTSQQSPPALLSSPIRRRDQRLRQQAESELKISREAISKLEDQVRFLTGQRSRIGETVASQRAELQQQAIANEELRTAVRNQSRARQGNLTRARKAEKKLKDIPEAVAVATDDAPPAPPAPPKDPKDPPSGGSGAFGGTGDPNIPPDSGVM